MGTVRWWIQTFDLYASAPPSPAPSLSKPQDKGWLCLENYSPWPFAPQFRLKIIMQPGPLP